MFQTHSKLQTVNDLDIGSTARRAVVATIKARARAYACNPMRLEIISEGLSNASADTMIAVADYLIATAQAQSRRWWGLGGEVPLLNLKGVKLLGRILRRARYRAEKQVSGTAENLKQNKADSQR